MSEPLLDIEGPYPRDEGAERAVLAACLVSPLAFGAAEHGLSDTDWFQPSHRLIWQLMRALAADGKPVDATLVHSALIESSDPSHTQALTELPALVTFPVVAASVPHYIDRIVETATRRALMALGQGLAQRAGALSVTESLQWATDELAIAHRLAMGADDDEDEGLSLDALMDLELRHSWVVPGLLGQGDRFMLTAGEGWGKSMLLRQMGVCIASGMHPFTLRPIEPKRVLHIDCENGPKLSQDKYRPLHAKMRTMRAEQEDRFRLYLHPTGLDLITQGDANRVLRRVDRFRPDVLIIGPVYHLMQGSDPNDERVASKVAQVVDRAREISGCAVLMEAHTPHNDNHPGKPILRPFGASLWKRWPEFGFCLDQIKPDNANTIQDILEERRSRLVPWRGARDERSWPADLRAGGPLPWFPYDAHAARVVAIANAARAELEGRADDAAS